MSLACQLTESMIETDPLFWMGQSGRLYRLYPESLPGFQLRDGDVHVLVCGEDALWAGTASDVVADPQSRAHFRDAMAAEISVYRLEPTPDAEARAMIVWDIQHGHPSAPLKLVDAG